MKKNNQKQKIYIDQLSKSIIKQSDGKIPKNEADVAAREVSKALLKEGDSLDLRTVRDTAAFIVKQKQKLDNDVIVVEDGVIYDKETNTIIN